MKVALSMMVLLVSLLSCKSGGSEENAELTGAKKKSTPSSVKKATLVISCKESFATPRPNFTMNIVMPKSGDKPSEYDASYESGEVNWNFTQDGTRLATWQPSGETLKLFVNFGQRMYSSLEFDGLTCDGQTKGRGEVSMYVGGFAGTSKSQLLNCVCTPP